jgi:glutamine synthetase type III
MNRTRLAALLALGCALSIGLVACGEDENNAFKEDYNVAVKPLSELNADVRESIATAGGASNDEIAKRFQELADRTQQARDNLAELEPPEDAKEPFDEFVSSLQESTEDMRAIVTAAREADPAAAKQASKSFKASSRELQRAETALRNAVDG